MAEFPKSGVIYRIRNVDSRLYLERSAVTPAAAQMRSEDATSRRQHWKFVKFADGPPVEYRILDPYPGPTVGALWYNPNPVAPAPSVVVGRPVASQHNTWTVVANTTNPNENAFYLLPNDPQGVADPMVGNTILSPTTAFIGFQAVQAAGNPQTRAANFQWQLSEVSPAALPTEPNSKYRIRAFLGKPLQVDASGNLNLDPTDARGDQRVWTITDQGNGQCTVFSDRAQKFLTARNVSTTGFDWQPTLRAATEPAFQEAERMWTFEKTTNLTHTIFIERRVTVQTATGQSIELNKLALALDGNTAILKPKKLAHNEVWIVEPTDTPMPGVTGGGTETGVGVGPGVTPSFGFPPGLRGDVTYRLRNPESPSVTAPDYIRLIWGSGAYIYNSGGHIANAVGIRVETKTNGGVALYSLDLGSRYYLNMSGSSIVATQLSVADTAYAWTITRTSTTDGGARYTIAAANGQLLTTSSGSLVVTTAANPPAPTQVWNFT